MESKDLQGAVKRYTRALELARVAEAYAGRAPLAKKLGRTSEALADYTKAVQIAPIVDYYVQQAALYDQIETAVVNEPLPGKKAKKAD